MQVQPRRLDVGDRDQARRTDAEQRGRASGFRLRSDLTRCRICADREPHRHQGKRLRQPTQSETWLGSSRVTRSSRASPLAAQLIRACWSVRSRLALRQTSDRVVGCVEPPQKPSAGATSMNSEAVTPRDRVWILRGCVCVWRKKNAAKRRSTGRVTEPAEHPNTSSSTLAERSTTGNSDHAFQSPAFSPKSDFTFFSFWTLCGSEAQNPRSCASDWEQSGRCSSTATPTLNPTDAAAIQSVTAFGIAPGRGILRWPVLHASGYQHRLLPLPPP